MIYVFKKKKKHLINIIQDLFKNVSSN